MTARTLMPEAICCATDCGRLGEFHLSLRMWAASDPERLSGSIELLTSMVVCDAHRLTPPSTAGEFFTPETRASISAELAAIHRPPPNFDGAVWQFLPVATPDKKAAN